MNKIFLIILIFFSKICLSQFETTNFSGFIQTNDSVIFPYEIEVSRLGSLIEGHSISDKGGKSETKTAFIITKENGRLFFREDKIVYTKADYSTFDDFCLVTFESDEKKFFNSKRLTLDFKGVFNDNSSCINGKLSLVSNDFIQKSFSRTEKRISNSKILEKKFGDTIVEVKNKIKELKSIFINNQEVDLLKNDYLKFNIYESYRIYIRDFGIVDQDKINIKINNNTESLVIIEDKPYYFKIDRDRRKNIIQIIGLENGEVPPITAQIIIESTSKKILHKINLKLLPKEVSKIELNF